MAELETVEEAAQRLYPIAEVVKNQQPYDYNLSWRKAFMRGAECQTAHHDLLYKSIRELRNELRDKYEVADFNEAGRLKEQVKGIDMILTKFEQFKQ